MAPTRRYVNGERARFVSPLALFLFTVFLMFATIGARSAEMTKDFIRDQRDWQDVRLCNNEAARLVSR